MVIPSWHDLHPDSGFIRTLHRKPPPGGLEHHLWHAFGNTHGIRTLKPIDPYQVRFVAACQGDVRPNPPAETARLKFDKAYPARSSPK